MHAYYVKISSWDMGALFLLLNTLRNRYTKA
jgi:hypothetical protein